MKKLLYILFIFLLSCSGGGGSSAAQETAALVVDRAQVVPSVETRIPINLTQEEWLALDIQYQPAKPDFIHKLKNGIPQTIVIMGTSLSAVPQGGNWTDIFSDKLNAEFGELVNIINFCHGGESSHDGLKILQSVIDTKPDVVFIEYSMNDSHPYYGISVRESYDNLDTIVQGILKENPNCEIIIETMNPAYGKHAEQRSSLKDYYQAYRYYAYSHNMKFIDYYKMWLDVLKDNQLQSTYIPDDIHPAQEGAEIVIIPTLMKYIM